MDMTNIWLAIGLTTFAGLATGLGGLIILLFESTNTKILSIALGFSAGVMIYISFVELLADSKEMLVATLGQNLGSIVNLLSFFAGILLIAIIDKIVPSPENPHEAPPKEGLSSEECYNKKLLRIGSFTALVIAIHNFPEGMATFVTSIQSPSLGIAIAIAVAIHNIPEGMSVAIPIYCATGDKKKAFYWSLLSGLTEPLGALMAYLILLPILNDTIFGILFGAIAGIMVFISLDELLPTAGEYGEHHLSIYGLVAGMIVIAFSLLILH
jgi:ZIP family zinc transporter